MKNSWYSLILNELYFKPICQHCYILFIHEFIALITTTKISSTKWNSNSNRPSLWINPISQTKEVLFWKKRFFGFDKPMFHTNYSYAEVSQKKRLDQGVSNTRHTIVANYSFHRILHNLLNTGVNYTNLCFYLFSNYCC